MKIKMRISTESFVKRGLLKITVKNQIIWPIKYEIEAKIK